MYNFRSMRCILRNLYTLHSLNGLETVYSVNEKNIDIYFRLDAERLAAECNMRLYRTSVKEDLNVGSVFQHLAENYVNKVNKCMGKLVPTSFI